MNSEIRQTLKRVLNGLDENLMELGTLPSKYVYLMDKLEEAMGAVEVALHDTDIKLALNI